MLILLLFACLAQSTADRTDVVYTAFAGADGMRWETQIHKSDLQGLPTWDPDVSDAPVLTPAQAIRAATEVMKQLSLKTWPEQWSVDAVTLRLVGGAWVYVVNFDEGPPPCHPPPGWGCGSSWGHGPMEIVVLPNGRALKPAVSNKH